MADLMVLPKMHEMCTLDYSGDTRLQWDPTDPVQTAAARKRFDELRGKGFLPFRVSAKGNQGEQLKSFDPDAERLIFVPAMVGG